jgi:hypothetical protein
MKKVTWDWESLDEHTYRVKVFGGWMVVTQLLSGKGNISISSIFVADRDHEWYPVKPSDPIPLARDAVPELLKGA